jgi:hypothetical protein
LHESILQYNPRRAKKRLTFQQKSPTRESGGHPLKGLGMTVSAYYSSSHNLANTVSNVEVIGNLPQIMFVRGMNAQTIKLSLLIFQRAAARTNHSPFESLRANGDIL